MLLHPLELLYSVMFDQNYMARTGDSLVPLPLSMIYTNCEQSPYMSAPVFLKDLPLGCSLSINEVIDFQFRNSVHIILI